MARCRWQVWAARRVWATGCGLARHGGGEILHLAPGLVTVLTDGSADGMRVGEEVRLEGLKDLSPDDSWIGRIIDPFGQPLDGRPLLRGPVARPLRAAAPPAASRRRLGPRMSTGIAVFDTLLPLVQGQRIGLHSALTIFGRSIIFVLL